MPETAPDVTEEKAILARLALAHKTWRDQRPPPPPPAPPEQRRKMMMEYTRNMLEKVQNPKPQDVEAIREAGSDPLGTAIWSQLSVVGWRLYAKGGEAALKSLYPAIERDHHPTFVIALRRARRNLGFPNDPRGTWKPSDPI